MIVAAVFLAGFLIGAVLTAVVLACLERDDRRGGYMAPPDKWTHLP